MRRSIGELILHRAAIQPPQRHSHAPRNDEPDRFRFHELRNPRFAGEPQLAGCRHRSANAQGLLRYGNYLNRTDVKNEGDQCRQAALPIARHFFAEARKGWDGTAQETISYSSSPGRPNGGGNQDNRAAGMSRPALVQNKARGSALGTSFKGDLVVSHPGEEVLLAFGKQFKLRQGDAAWLCDLREALCEEAVAVAGDFENEVRRHLIAPGVVIEELRINMNLGALLWRLGIGKRRLRVQEMKTDVNDTGGSRSIGQHNDPDTLFRIVSDE